MGRLLALAVLLIGANLKGGETPIPSHPDPNDAMVVDDYTPRPRIVAQAETIERLAAAAKPTIVWNGDMLWVKPGGQGRFSFAFATAQWVRVGKARPFWALLRPRDHGTYERELGGLLTAEIRNASVRDLAAHKSDSDHGGGDYAQVILRDRDHDLYEIGIQSEGLGSGLPVDERRIYVLRSPDGRWRFVGEGLPESSGKCGPLCSGSGADAHARLTGHPRAPVIIEFTTTRSSALVGEGVESAYPMLGIHREALLDGPLPAKLRWLTDPYVSIDTPGDTLGAVIQRYTYWELNGASEDFAKYSLKEAARFKRLAEQRNPALLHGMLPVGTIVHLPSREEFVNPRP